MSRYADPSDPLNGPEHHSGKPCVERGCSNPAGTAWSPFWCQQHNAARMKRIDASFNAMAISHEVKKLGATVRPPSVGVPQSNKEIKE